MAVLRLKLEDGKPYLSCLGWADLYLYMIRTIGPRLATMEIQYIWHNNIPCHSIRGLLDDLALPLWLSKFLLKHL